MNSNIQLTRLDQEISRINNESRINPERRYNPDSQINLESLINCLIRINSPIWPTFKIPSKLSAGRTILRQRYNCYVAYSVYVDPNLQARREIILRQRNSGHIEYNLYVDPSWRQKK